jgi:hypothetical protein
MSGKKFEAPAQFMRTQTRAKADPISPEDMDPWVYEFSSDNTSQ